MKLQPHQHQIFIEPEETSFSPTTGLPDSNAPRLIHYDKKCKIEIGFLSV